MRTLRPGMTGDDVRAWELFLRGIRPCSDVVVDGVYEEPDLEEAKIFQRAVGFSGGDVDAIIGPLTLTKAMELGFNPGITDDHPGEDGPNWPAPPDHGPISVVDREKLFGKFAYVATPTTGNPEAIRITDGWAGENIVGVTVPQLKGVSGAPSSLKVSFHKKGAGQLVALFAAWEAAGLRDRVLTWAGSWNPRFVRGSRTNLSNHAWGTAFDINVAWNMLGTVPALKGKRGSVRELVQIADQHGFYWGGWFKGRQDGMHFELFQAGG